MLDIENLKFRSSILQKTRAFFIARSYIELDTPSLSPALIPDTATEVFKTFYDDPWTDEEKTVFTVPSHEYFLKKAVAVLKTPVFQLSKCFRNSIPSGRLNSPELTLLEFYTPGTSYIESAELTEALLSALSDSSPTDDSTDKTSFTPLPRPPFKRMTMDEAFKTYAGFLLSECTDESALAAKVRELGIPEFPDNPFDEWPMDELFELVLSQCVEPALPENEGIFLFDQPSFVPSLAKQKAACATGTGSRLSKHDICWKEQWALYVNGTKIAVSRSEETDAGKVKAYLKSEGRLKNATARIKPVIDQDFWKTVENMPECSSVELNADRLIMLLAGEKSIENVIPFPFRLKTGYY